MSLYLYLGSRVITAARLLPFFPSFSASIYALVTREFARLLRTTARARSERIHQNIRRGKYVFGWSLRLSWKFRAISDRPWFMNRVRRFFFLRYFFPLITRIPGVPIVLRFSWLVQPGSFNTTKHQRLRYRNSFNRIKPKERVYTKKNRIPAKNYESMWMMVIRSLLYLEKSYEKLWIRSTISIRFLWKILNYSIVFTCSNSCSISKRLMYVHTD